MDPKENSNIVETSQIDYLRYPFLEVANRLPENSVLEIKLGNLPNNSSIKDEEITLLDAALEIGMEECNLLLNEQSVNLKKAAVVLANFPDGRKGIYLTVSKPRQQLLTSLPGGILDGKDPYFGITCYGDKMIQYHTSQGNELVLPGKKSGSRMTLEEKDLMHTLLKIVSAYAPVDINSSDLKYVPTKMLGEDITD